MHPFANLNYLSTCFRITDVQKIICHKWSRMSESKWYVLRSKPNKEDLLYNQLLTRGFETYFPRLEVNPVNPRARKTKPFFPGYMFIRISLEDVGFSTFQWMPYATGLVSFDKEPATIREDMMQTLINNIERLKEMQEDKSMPFEPGSKLLINSGPFEGFEAIFDTSLPGRDRIRVLLTMIQGNQVSVELPPSQVRRKK